MDTVIQFNVERIKEFDSQFNAVGYIFYTIVEDTIVVSLYSYETLYEHTREEMETNLLSLFSGEYNKITFLYRSNVWCKDYNNLLI